MSLKLDIKIEELVDIEYLSQQWKALEKEANASFFLTWHWIYAWVNLSTPETHILRLSAYDDGQLIALALFNKKNIIRRGILHSRVLELNDYGLPGLNMVIEHNGILAARGYEESAPSEMLKYLSQQYDVWDELNINGINEGDKFIDRKLIKILNLEFVISSTSESRYVDLDRLRNENIEYLSTLSRNTRYQIRRAIKKYNNSGKLVIDVAKDVSEALEYFEGLKTYHQAHWNLKGHSGCFSNPNWIKFHTDIIVGAVENGEIQLMRVLAGEKIVGYLYNFIRDKRVYMIQSGFNYENDTSLHPGYVTHYMAIEYNLNAGNSIYDFLAGDARYKRSMSSNSTRLLWVTLQKQRLRLRIERLFKTVAIYLLRKDRNVEF